MVSNSGTTGSGQAIVLNRATFERLNLGDGGTLNLNGKTAFTAELYFKYSSLSGGSSDYLMSSLGIRLPGESTNQAFSLQVLSDSSLKGTLNVAGTERIITSSAGAVSSGTVYHAAITYDGSNVRLFLNGTLIGTVAATGTIRQNVAEDVMLGAPALAWPDSGGLVFSPNGFTADGVRVSDNARYTATGAPPTTKPSSDSHTLLLANFDNVSLPFITAQSASGNLSLVVRSPVGSGYLSNLQISNLTFFGSGGGSGLYTFDTPYMKLNNISTAGRYGFLFDGQKFLSSFDNLRATTDASTARIGMAFVGGACPSCVLTRADIEGFPYGYVAIEGPPKLRDLFLNTAVDSIAPMVVKGQGAGSVEIQGLWLDDETAPAVGVTRDAGVIFSTMSIVHVIGGAQWMNYQNAPVFRFHSPDIGSSMSIDSARLFVNSSAPEVIKFTGTGPTVPLQLRDSVKFTDAFTLSTVPWSTTPNYVNEQTGAHFRVQDGATTVFEVNRGGVGRVEGWFYDRNGSDGFALTPSSLLVGNAFKLIWRSGGNWYTGAQDTSVERGAEGVLKLTSTFSTPATSPAQFTANTDNLAITGSGWLRLSTDASRDLTGIVAGIDGQRLEITNVGSNNLVIKHQSASSTAANRIICNTGADITLAANEELLLKYDATTQRWRASKK